MKCVAVIILSFNEERHIVRALQSVAPFAQQVFVVDSYSTDRTVELARRHGATVLENAFVNQAKQFQWALANARLESPWVMRLDADEIVEPPLAAEILRELPGLPDDVAGINLRRKHIFMGRWIRHGGRYPLLMLRIWRRGRGRVEDRWMDEHISVLGGRTITFRGDFQDCNLGDLASFTDKHNRYATREAIDILNRRWGLFPGDAALTSSGTSSQVALKRLIKEQFYNRLPFFVSTPLYFLWRYVVRLGFLDGREGLIYHFLQGFWYRFLVGARVLELDRALAGLGTNQERVRRLSQLTGYPLPGAAASEALPTPATDGKARTSP